MKGGKDSIYVRNGKQKYGVEARSLMRKLGAVYSYNIKFPAICIVRPPHGKI
ncbi:MAG: hypothetical protein ACP5MT_00095 [Candidatus Acidifodinimicrobium sp.]